MARRILAGVSAQATPERDIVSWDDLDRLVADLAGRLAGTTFDVMLCITRGGLVPAGMLAYRLRIRNILVAAVAFYDDEGQPGPHPTFLQFPADPLLRGQRVLIVDEVWESGTTIHAVTERVVQAGGIPTTVVLHYKPRRSRVPGEPDLFAAETMGALTPRAIGGMEPDLVGLVDGLLDAMAAKGEVDLIEDFAAAIPIEVIGNLLGVPAEEREPLRDWSLAILGALEPVVSPEVSPAATRP